MNIQADRISFKETGAFNAVVTDYLNQSPALAPFYAHAPVIGSFDKILSSRNFPASQRSILADTLLMQYAGLDAGKKVTDNIAALRDNDTFTVTTGHQLSIFGGPLYFVYKIVSAIKLAQQLTDRYPKNKIVPVFWMASEDHDIEEISSIHLFGKDIQWNTGYIGAAGRTGTHEFEEILISLKEIMGDSSPNALALAAIFEEAYNGKRNLAQSTHYWVNALFGEYGLVIIDPDHTSFKAIFAPYLLKELEQGLSHAAVEESSARLGENYKLQVHPRQINLFYLEHNIRERIEKNEDGTFSVLNTDISFTKQEMANLVSDHPERLSPNVVLRPLYQEVLLPNLAYIGGGAEVAYWLQYKAMFERFDVAFPMILLRNSAMWVDKATHSKASKLNISGALYFEETDALIKKFIEQLPGSEVNLNDEKQTLSEVYETIKLKAADIDVTLQASVEADLSRALKQIHNIEEKLIRAEKRKHETELAQIRAIKDKLFPGGVLQERHDSFIPHFLKHGKEFFDALILNFDPLGKDFVIISEV